MRRLLIAIAALICFAVLSGSANAQSCANGQCSIVQRGNGYTYTYVQSRTPMTTTACPAGGQCAAGQCLTGTCAPQAVAYTHYHASYATVRGGGCGNGNRAARRAGRRGLFGGLFHCGG